MQVKTTRNTRRRRQITHDKRANMRQYDVRQSCNMRCRLERKDQTTQTETTEQGLVSTKKTLLNSDGSDGPIRLI